MFYRFCIYIIVSILIVSYSRVDCGRSKHAFGNCPHYNARRSHNERSPTPYSASGRFGPVSNTVRDEEEEPSTSSEEDEEYEEAAGPQVRHMANTGVREKSMRSAQSRNDTTMSSPNPQDKENEISEYFLKAYFPELNDFYPGTPVGPHEYHITIAPNIKEIRNKLAKKIQQTSDDFTHAIQTIRTMLNEETVEAVSSLITLPSTEFQFIKNVIKILKVTMENVVLCVSTAGSRLMALPKRWSLSYQSCVVDEFKESWGIIENVHHIFQNAVYYVKNFINKLETCFNHEESLVQWCINDIFNDVPSYVQDTVSKLNRELDNGVTYLKAVPVRVEKCEMTDNAEKKLLLPFMIIREMVKCVLTKAEL